ncbi:hypothetical protein [Rhodohalobacter sp. 614A]|uniref:hypothetical protein n=1 Tax=Rhodohalobacter sp. 614A TaxID=2908649 RepID=UPI001F371454|nr:hypothetical protein [Rhodohalobacter sp. 614A]
MKFKDTTLQHIEFGNEPVDQYYCLVDKRISPNGLEINKMKLTDPRNIDQEFRNHGMLMMFTGDEIESLMNRGDLDRENLHESLYNLALQEGVIKED